MKRLLPLLLALFLFTAGCTSKPVGLDGSLDSGSSALPVSSEEPTESLPDPSEETAASEPESSAEPVSSPAPVTSSAPSSAAVSSYPDYTPVPGESPYTSHPDNVTWSGSVMDGAEEERVAIWLEACDIIAEQVNLRREAAGLPPLNYRDDLKEAAARYAKETGATSLLLMNAVDQYKPGRTAAATFAKLGLKERVVGDSICYGVVEHPSDPDPAVQMFNQWLEKNWDRINETVIQNTTATAFTVGYYPGICCIILLA